MFSNARQTQRENEKHRELLARKGRALNNKLAGRDHTQRRRRGKERFAKNKDKANSTNPKDDPKRRLTARNPHSTLLKDKTGTKTEKNAEDRDMSKVKCYNCNKFGHFASKCPLPRRPRNQRKEQLKALAAQALPNYSEEDQLTPEAVRDKLQFALSGFAANMHTQCTGSDL